MIRRPPRSTPIDTSFPSTTLVRSHAVFKIGSNALKNGVMVSLSAISFIAIFFLNVPCPIVVIAAALIGFLGGKVMEDKFYVIKGHAAKKANEEAARSEEQPSDLQSLMRTS